ncbi:BTB/POZ fold domain containing protein [Cordyceps fumosorosea ARSEF 2679]|uniref:BTB/POZ fold domain containing protein n=1 Tax=Cordyceps fumosorosea (strain ARSEF 2679) TaxID=1081104 RepID=A0A167VVM2_CORFA|nr:BTB/POZ fold domain containing protein [Cordyceps fumosorosea ARSEF 2679]OAA63028.1 BTB/POZ fold domain containing protein [Cordyceps fumosorosea ARSEF 2679]
MASSTPAATSDSGQTEQTIHKIPDILPRERVFPIQIGGELFKLSGASISSDAPSYFSQYFLCQIKTAEKKGQDISSSIRTLYIDRDPVTFGDIALHLQGYHLQPRDGTHFVRLFADAQFYNLPKLMSQLYEESIFISIGHREFQIPRDVLTDPGNSPNYFSLGFGLMFARRDEVFPGLDREGLIRPPSILPPSVSNRSADTFAELLHLLHGYPVNIRDETHRDELLRDARYFHFKGLEQKLIPHSISFNSLRERNEIVLRLENVQKSGVYIVHDRAEEMIGEGGMAEFDESLPGWINYARPYVDDTPAELVLEIGGEKTRLHFTSNGPRAEFFGDTRTRVSKLFEVIATKLGLPPTTQPLGLLMASGGARSLPAAPGNTPLSEDLVKVKLGPEAAVTLDGQDYTYTHPPSADNADSVTMNSRKRRRGDAAASDEQQEGEQWTIKRGQWRLRIQRSTHGKSNFECAMEAVCLDAFSSELGRNKRRGFLSG